MEQEVNNTFEYVNNEKNEVVENTNIEEVKVIDDNQKLSEDFVTGLPSWDLTPPYEVIRRVNR